MTSAGEPKTAVLSGAGSGIGRATALELSQAGFRVGLLGRRRQSLDLSLAECPAGGSSVAVDVRDAEQVAAAVASLTAELGPPEVVVAAAGVARVARFVELPAEQFQETIETNLIGSANLFRACLPGMLERGRGTLVAILSVAARRVFPAWSAYAASKWGLLGLVESLREELRGSGVRVLAITPGATASALWDDIGGSWDREKMIPAAEVARAVRWSIDSGDRGGVVVEEVRLQPPGGDL